MKNLNRNVGIPERLSEPEPFSISQYHRILTVKPYEEDARLSVYSVAGQFMQSYPIPGNGESRINLERLPAGIYLIRIETRGKEAISRKIGLQ